MTGNVGGGTDQLRDMAHHIADQSFGIAGIILLIRFLLGIGAGTNVNDGYSWGIWVVYDVMVGSAFACGGYAVALLVYIFNKGKYHPLVRPALLGSLFGYTLAGASVIIDLGRYWNTWHISPPAGPR